MKITWFGHAAFRVDIGGSVVLIDPFLSQNPSFRGDLRQAVAGVSHIVLTHGHGDHLGDTVPIAKDSGATVVANACATRPLQSAAGAVSAAQLHQSAMATIGDLYAVVVGSSAALG